MSDFDEKVIERLKRLEREVERLQVKESPNSADFVKLTGDQTVAGVKTFSSFPVTPSSAPSSNYQVSNKKYVDDLIGAWQSYTVSWTAATTNPSIGNGTLAGRYVQIGKTVICSISLVMGSTTTYGSGNWSLSLPKTVVSVSVRYIGQFTIYDASPGGNYAGNAMVGSNQSAINLFVRDQGGSGLNSTTPHTWASDDELFLTIVYETA